MVAFEAMLDRASCAGSVVCWHTSAVRCAKSGKLQESALPDSYRKNRYVQGFSGHIARGLDRARRLNHHPCRNRQASSDKMS